MRISHVARLRSEIKKLKGLLYNNEMKKIKNRNAFINESFYIKWSMPWWYKIIAYLLSFIFALVSIFFIIVKAITLGNFKTTKWLITVIIGIVSENIFIEPIKVCFF